MALDARATLNFSFTVSDAAVARGTSSLAGSSGFLPSGNSPTYTGDVGDFISFTANETALPTHLTGNLTINASFAAGAISASSFTYNGLSASSALGGTFGSDNNSLVCTGPACTVSGQLAATATANPVPEPASLAALGLGSQGLPPTATVPIWRRRNGMCRICLHMLRRYRANPAFSPGTLLAAWSYLGELASSLPGWLSSDDREGWASSQSTGARRECARTRHPEVQLDPHCATARNPCPGRVQRLLQPSRRDPRRPVALAEHALQRHV